MCKVLPLLIFLAGFMIVFVPLVIFHPFKLHCDAKELNDCKDPLSKAIAIVLYAILSVIGSFIFASIVITILAFIACILHLISPIFKKENNTEIQNV